MRHFTPAELYTTQFYTWEYRGRGWFLADEPVYLEPPFIPFFRHGYPTASIDDGKRPTLLSKALETFRGKTPTIQTQPEQLDYETIEPFLYEEEIDVHCLCVTVPKQRKGGTESMKALLVMLSNIQSPISFELIGTASTIRLYFVAKAFAIDTIETYLGAFFPEYTAQRSDGGVGIFTDADAILVTDFGLQQEFVRPLQMAKGLFPEPLIGIYAVCDRLSDTELAGMQILFQPVVNQWSESIVRSVTLNDGSSFFIDSADAPLLAKQKVQAPLYAVTIRAFAQADTVEHATTILQRLSFAIVQASKSPHNELRALPDDAYDVVLRIEDIVCRESHRLGMLLNLDELLTFVHFPGDQVISPKLYHSTRKTKAVPVIAQQKQIVLGINNHSGIPTKVSVSVEDRMKHTHILGATGMGKSTLITQLVLQDIQAGIGVIVCDPHGDLIDDIIARIPSDRLDDVILIDPSDMAFPIGLNILEAKNDVEKEVLSSDIVASFRKYATSWGDQMNSILSNAILALLESSQGGSLHDLRRFLLEKDFRSRLLATVRDYSVLYYWQHEYPLLKTNSLGPILTRLDTFLRPKSIRNMVVQKTGIDFETLCNGDAIILCKLSQGLIGKENSYLLGSLILSKLHQVLLRRQQHAVRNPLFIYLDEFQHFITPSITEMLSGIRKYNVGLILSHQDLQQLQRQDSELQNSVFSNCLIRIVFRVGEPDAKKLQDGFSGFDFIDLQNLGRGEAVVRIEQPQYDCSLDTLPLPSVQVEQLNTNLSYIIAQSRTKYGTPQAEVEQMLAETLRPTSFATKEKASPSNPVPPTPPPHPYESSPLEPGGKNFPDPDQQAPKKDNTQPPPATQEISENSNSTHRYLQTLVKKMAEARGYVATLEAQLHNSSGKVDVMLIKDGKRIAIEISNTTDADWEMHNISKCIDAQFDLTISLSGDQKQLERIKKKCSVGISNFQSVSVLFFTPDALWAYLDESLIDPRPEETVIKGYRVHVSYDSISQAEMERKKASVAKIVLNSLKKRKDK